MDLEWEPIYFPGDEDSVSQEFVPTSTALPRCYRTSHAQSHKLRDWLQIQELEAVQLPLVERQSTAKKCLTHLPCGIAQDVKAQDLSRKCTT